MNFNPLLNSTGITVIENRFLESNQGVFIKENSELLVGNIYPFLFLGCGKIYTLEECVEFGLQYAMGVVNLYLNK